MLGTVFGTRELMKGAIILIDLQLNIGIKDQDGWRKGSYRENGVQFLHIYMLCSYPCPRSQNTFLRTFVIILYLLESCRDVPEVPVCLATVAIIFRYIPKTMGSHRGVLSSPRLGEENKLKRNTTEMWGDQKSWGARTAEW